MQFFTEIFLFALAASLGLRFWLAQRQLRHARACSSIGRVLVSQARGASSNLAMSKILGGFCSVVGNWS